MKRRIPIIATIGAIIGIFLLLQNPVNAKLLRLEFIGAIVVAWIGLAWIFWKWKKFRFLWIVIPLILIIPFLLLGRQIDPDILRETYLRRLITFNGTRYYWGGKPSRN